MTKPQERPDLPSPLGWISKYPWLAFVIVTAAASLVAGWLRYRDQTSTASLPGGAGPFTVHRPVSLTRAEAAQARQALMGQVRRTWIDGVLDRSLAQVARIALGLAEQPGQVSHPWGTLMRQPGFPDQQLPPGTRLSQIADPFDHHILVLGAPGAGKTTLLLEYAHDLLDEADHDLAARVPVVFHLSGWPATQPPLAGWLAAELGLRYGVTQRLAQELVDHDRLAILLDGLDEVPGAYRRACVAAINTFRSEHGGVPLVICARSREYTELAEQLTLNGAVEVQPLEPAQVRHWLAEADRPLAGLRTALRDRKHWLWELLGSPLVLSIAALTYTGQRASAIRTDGSIKDLFDAYVDAMLTRPRAPLAARGEQAYQDTDTVRWLAWLAGQMGQESVFYPDWIQLRWLPTRGQRWLAAGGFTLAAMLVVGLPIGLVAWPRSGLTAAIFLAAGGGMAALLASFEYRIEPVEQPQWSWRHARERLALGIMVGLTLGASAGLGFGLESGLASILTTGLPVLLVSGLGVVLAAGFEPRPNLRPSAPLDGIRAAVRAARTIGIVIGLAVGLAMGVACGFALGLEDGLTAALAFGLGAGLTAWLYGGGGTYLRHRQLCALLRRKKLIPSDLIDFLEYADSRILLRRAGGGYLFVHRMLQDYFAAQAQHTPQAGKDPAGTSQTDAQTTAPPH